MPHLKALVYIKSMDDLTVDFDFYSETEPFEIYSKLQVERDKFIRGTIIPYLGKSKIENCVATLFN